MCFLENSKNMENIYQNQWEKAYPLPKVKSKLSLLNYKESSYSK